MKSNQNYNCEHCKHFYQHYVRSARGKYVKAYAGHCSRPRIKSRKPDAPGCQHFAQRP